MLGKRLRVSPSGTFQFQRFFESSTQIITPDGAALEAFRFGPGSRDSLNAIDVQVLSSNTAAPDEVAESTRLTLITFGDTGVGVVQGATVETVNQFNALGIVTPGFIDLTVDAVTQEIIVTLTTGVAKNIKHDLFITTDVQVPVVDA